MGKRILRERTDVTENEEITGTMPDKKPADLSATDDPAPAESTASDVEFPPTLSGYFSEQRATPSAFFKILRKNAVKHFRSDDREAAGKLMIDLDPEGERLWALMSQSTLPDAIDTWVWGAAQVRLKEKLGETFDPQDHDATRVLKVILTCLSPGLRSNSKDERKNAETWLRIGICWLVEKRALKSWQVAEGLRSIFFPELKSAARLAQRSIQRGKISELRLAVAVAGLGDQMVREAAEERDRERSTAADLRQRLDDARKTIEKLSSELEGARETIAEHEAAISKLEQTLTAERQHWGHDLTETKAEQKVLLSERLAPLLEDAIDALEIDPPAPGTALRRTKSALAVIKEVNE